MAGDPGCMDGFLEGLSVVCSSLLLSGFSGSLQERSAFRIPSGKKCFLCLRMHNSRNSGKAVTETGGRRYEDYMLQYKVL